jgi:hypothetical protein
MPSTKHAVTVVTPWFPSVPGEREGNYVYDSARAISEKAWSVSVVVSRPYRARGLDGSLPGWSPRTLSAESFPTFDKVRLVKHLSVPRNLAPRISDALLDRSMIPVLRRTVEETASIVIHAHTESLAPAAVAVGRMTGSKVVVTLHGINVGPPVFSALCPRPTESFWLASRCDRFSATWWAVMIISGTCRMGFR